jgi:hypothetical protein
MKIVPGEAYMRRRDKKVVVVDRVTGQGVEYHLKSDTAEAKFKISLDGFRKGIRPLTAEEKQRENTTAGSVAAAVPSEQ